LSGTPACGSIPYSIELGEQGTLSIVRELCSIVDMTKAEPANVATDWELITAQLPADWRELAEKMGLLEERPEHIGAKVDDIEPILRLVLYQAGASDSLRATVARGAALGLLAISHVALHKWMKKLGAYLVALLTRMVATASFAPEKWCGFDLIAGDATTVQRPGSKGTTARVHYALRLSDLTPRHIEVTDEHGGETARRFQAEPDELWLLDRGYSNPAGVASIRDRGAHIIVRVNRATLPLHDQRGKPINIMARLRRTDARERIQQCRVFVHVGERKVPGRLCWVRLPQDKAAQARQRVRREAEGSCDDDTLFAAEFVLVFTTVLHELSATQILTAYRARWQVELDFKRSKSIRELDRLPNFLPQTIHSWICAKLLLQLVAVRIASPAAAIPPSAAGITILPTPAPCPASPQARSSRRSRHAAVVCGPARLERRLRGPVASAAR
jgi:hypothetical protein